MIEIKNVSFAYRVSDAEGKPVLRSAVKDLNLTIHGGEFIVLTGSSGCGKTTVCRELLKALPQCAFLDGDWCWMMDPFIVNEETKKMVQDNIIHLLRSY